MQKKKSTAHTYQRNRIAHHTLHRAGAATQTSVPLTNFGKLRPWARGMTGFVYHEKLQLFDKNGPKTSTEELQTFTLPP
jgi:hypothetical protein